MKMKHKKIILIVTIFIAASILFCKFNNNTFFTENHYITEYGDEFDISADNFLNKVTITNKETSFSCRLQHYSQNDEILSLCDTPNIRVYEISGVKICKIKKHNNFFVLDEMFSNDSEINNEVKKMIVDDNDAKNFLDKYLK